MLKQDALYYINNEIMRKANKLQYIPKAVAPSTAVELFNCSNLIVWTGASESTIFQDASVNWSFRALHDDLHLKTRLGFNVLEEIEIGTIQANMFDSDLLREVVFSEVVGQAKYFKETGLFVSDQIGFCMNWLDKVNVLR